MEINFIELLDLKKHKIGGYYRETYRAETNITLQTEKYSLTTANYFYLAGTDFLVWHRQNSDCILHFYSGNGLTVHEITHDQQLIHTQLGDPSVHLNHQLQYVIPANHWVALELDCENSYALIGLTNHPGITEKDFEIADCQQLIKEYPDYQDIIIRLTNAPS